MRKLSLTPEQLAKMYADGSPEDRNRIVLAFRAVLKSGTITDTEYRSAVSFLALHDHYTSTESHRNWAGPNSVPPRF